MSNKPKRYHPVQEYILQVVKDHPADLVSFVSEQMDMSRQGVLRHVNHLINSGDIQAEGEQKGRRYIQIKPSTTERWFEYDLTGIVSEDELWRQDMVPIINPYHFPLNVMRILQYGFTEMVNNAIDHSNGTKLLITLYITHTDTSFIITDNGIGIFKKIQLAKNLTDTKQALLELAKGKFTTDKQRHSGQGIFFTSRMVSEFQIYSDQIIYSHDDASEKDFIFENKTPYSIGTTVYFKVNKDIPYTTKDIFDRYADENYDFSLTNVPVRMAETGDDLVSRSQAKRLLARLDEFKTVILDFSKVDWIGQAFADEIFRVFYLQHPEVEIVPLNTNESVSQMIQRAIMNRSQPEPLD